MRVNTLILIRDLLKAEIEERTEDLEKTQRILKNREEYKESGSEWDPSDDIKQLKTMIRRKRQLLSEATAAYEDFLGKEWN